MLTKEAWAEDACNQSMTCGPKKWWESIADRVIGPDLRICNSATLTVDSPRNLHLRNFPQFLSFLFAKPPNRLDTGVFSTNDNVN